MAGFTHAQMCQLAVRWLSRAPGKQGPGCQVAVSEVKSCWNGEIPDAFGARTVADDSGSVVIEVKCSRADFLADAAKEHRQQPHLGMGAFRYFMAPAGLIAAHELPQRWGLIEVDAKGVLTVVAGHVLSKRADQGMWRHEHSQAREWLLLATLLSRVGDAAKLHDELKAARNDRSRLARQCDELAASNRRLNLALSAAEHGPVDASAATRKARRKEEAPQV